MVDIARRVRGDVAVNHLKLTRPEKIFTRIKRHLGKGSRLSYVFYDASALWNSIFRKESFAGFCFSNAQRKVAGNIF